MAQMNASLLGRNELLALVKCGRELAAQVDLRPLLETILYRANQLTDSPDSSIILYNERTNALYFAAALGQNAAHLLENWGEFSSQQIPVAGSKAGEVFTSGQSIVVNQLPREGTHFKGVDRDTQRTTKSMVCVPLACAGERLGVMQICNRRRGRYEGRDKVLLESFAAQAAIAIRNARLFEDLLAHMGMRSALDPAAGTSGNAGRAEPARPGGEADDSVRRHEGFHTTVPDSQ
jgi:GAF domain-containing protein